MRSGRQVWVLALAAGLVACQSPSTAPSPTPPSAATSPTKGWPTLPAPPPPALPVAAPQAVPAATGFSGGVVREIVDSVYLPVERSTVIPPRYGLYTVILTRKVDRVSTRLLGELFAVTGSAGAAAIAPENLNLITLPVKSTLGARQALAKARADSEAAAATLLREHYDFDQADLLLTGVCSPSPDRPVDAAVRQACGADLPDGPLLVTTLLPLTAKSLRQPRMLVVNLSGMKLEAVREVLASYRRQITRQDFERQATSEHWRLAVLDGLLSASALLPSISKAYAGGK